MRVRLATQDDFAAFMELARPVEDLFGPMVNQPGFQDALTRNFQRGSALLAETDSGDAVGGMLFSLRTAPTYRIGWLVVDEQSRSRGLGQTLVAEGLRRWFEPPAVLEVVTFGPDHPGARSRRLYERLGFQPQEMTTAGPEGGSRQVYRLRLDRHPDWAS